MNGAQLKKKRQELAALHKEQRLGMVTFSQGKADTGAAISVFILPNTSHVATSAQHSKNLGIQNYL